MIEWYRCKHDFRWDGSVRDIYVFGTTQHDWDLFLDAIERWEYHMAFSINGEPAVLPNSAWRTFEMQPSAAPLLELHVGAVRIRCHFFCSRELELDLDPRDVQSQADVDAVTDFMVRLGKLLDKNVHLTPEDVGDAAIFEYRAADGAVVYNEPLQAATG